MAHVTVLGSANLDLVLRVAAIPGPGETALAHDRARHPGGKGLNQAVAAARAEVETRFVASLGEDAAGEELLEALHAAGVDTTAVQRSSAPSGTAYVVVQDDGENAIIVHPGANAAATSLSAAGRDAVRSGGVLLAQLEVPLELVCEAAALARAAGARVVLNAAPARQLGELLELVDVLVVNEHEAATLAREVGGPAGARGTADPADLAVERKAAVLAAGRRDVVVTLGAGGALHVDPAGTVLRVPALPAEVVDTTGAGDAFAGYLAAGLAGGATVPAALVSALAAGALAVEAHGAVPSIPTRAAVAARLAAAGVDLAPRSAV